MRPLASHFYFLSFEIEVSNRALASSAASSDTSFVVGNYEGTLATQRVGDYILGHRCKMIFLRRLNQKVPFLQSKGKQMVEEDINVVGSSSSKSSSSSSTSSSSSGSKE